MNQFQLITEICIEINNFQSQISDFTTFLGGELVDAWVGKIDNKDQLSPTEVEIRTEFGNRALEIKIFLSFRAISK